MLKLAQYLKYYKKEAGWGAFLKWLEAATGLIAPLVIAWLIDKGIGEGSRQVIVNSGAILLTLAVVGMVSALSCQYLASKASQGIGTILRTKMTAKINSFSHYDIEKYGKSGLVTRSTNDIYNIEKGTAMIVRLLFRAPFIVIGALIMAFIVNAKLALIFVVITPTVVLALLVITRVSANLFRSMQQRLDRIGLLTGEVMTGARVIRAFNKQEYEVNKLASANLELRKFSEKSGLLAALLSPINNIVLNLGIAAILFFGARLVNNAELSRGEVVADISYMSEIILQMVVVSYLTIILARGKESAIRVNEILSYNPTEQDEGSKSLLLTDELIRFDNVSFAYPQSQEWTLKNITFSIKKGEKIGIIGSTGSGKSTLINLILRFYTPLQGKIFIGNTDIKELNRKQLRDATTFAPQQVAIFYGTIEENILWGNPSTTEKQIEEALKVSQAYEFVDKYEDKVKHECLQNGRNLSGGQKQRIALARTVIKQAPIIIIDDSTTALDYKTSSDFYNALRNYLPNSTWIVVSQRVNSVKDLDKILVLEEGGIAGFDTHVNLAASNSIYKEIIASQIGGEIIE